MATTSTASAAAATPDAREYLATLVHTLSDIELALLLCLVAGRHCILTTDAGYVETLEGALEIVGSLEGDCGQGGEG